jgi:hypothetical protein
VTLDLCAPPLAATSAGAAEWHLTQSATVSAGLSAAIAHTASAKLRTTKTEKTLTIVARFFIVSPYSEIYFCKPIRSLNGHQSIQQFKIILDNVIICHTRQ